jgi:phenylalanine-4-hydroxylase
VNERTAAPAADNRLSLLVELKDEPGALETALRAFSAHGVNLTHIESRPARGDTFDFFVDCEGRREDPGVAAVIASLERTAVKLLVLDRQEVPWFPRHVSELDLIAEHTLEAGVELEADHPGFKDPEYRRRRAHIDGLARAYRHGEPIPEVDYSAREIHTWREIYERLKPLHRTHACEAYLRIVRELEEEAGYGPAAIPQARTVSAFLETRTGFRIRPVPGLLDSRDFLAGLAFRVFFATQYIRHHSKPHYTPEPDVCHELIGHAPMFADSAFADFSQEIGLASLGASDTEIVQLARCYWYSVEFGLLRERGTLKAYGAGLLSSSGELAWAGGGGDDGPELLDWEPAAAAGRAYPITEYQPTYFVARSLHDAKLKMQVYCRNLRRPFYARYNPATESIWVDRAVRRQKVG